VTWAKFRLPRPFGFRVRADVRDIRQTDGRRSPLNAPASPTGRGHNKLAQSGLTVHKHIGSVSGQEQDTCQSTLPVWKSVNLFTLVELTMHC